MDRKEFLRLSQDAIENTEIKSEHFDDVWKLDITEPIPKKSGEGLHIEEATKEPKGIWEGTFTFEKKFTEEQLDEIYKAFTSHDFSKNPIILDKDSPMEFINNPFPEQI